MIFGYARVSSADQNLDKQIKAIKAYGCEMIHSEKQSGKECSRAIYQEMRFKMKPGDVLVIYDLGCLGNSKKEIYNQWKNIIEDRIDIVVINMPILNTLKYKELDGMSEVVSTLVLTLLSWIVEEERNLIRVAQREGIDIAKKRGAFKGKPKKYHPEAKGKDKIIYDRVVELLQNNTPIMNIRRETGLARNTIYSIKKQIN